MSKQLPKVAPKAPQRTTKAGSSKAGAAHRRALFVEAYLSNGGNATAAAVAAGFAPKSAASTGCDLLKHPKVVDAMEARKAEALQKFRLTADDFYRSLAQALHFDPRKLYRDDGTVKDITELDDDTAAALAGVDVSEEFGPSEDGRKLIGYTKKLKWLDKNTARDQLGKALRLYAEQGTTTVNVNFADQLRAARERASRR